MAEKRFLDFMDRFDGGGMGTSGEKFEGGGLLSMLANLFATPRGSEDRAKQEAMTGLLGQISPPTAAPQAPAQDQSPLERFKGQQPAPYSSLGEYQMDPFGGAGPNIAGAAAERGMGVDPFGGYGSGLEYRPSVDVPSQMPGGQYADKNLGIELTMPRSRDGQILPDAMIVRNPPTGLPNPPARGIDSSYMDPFFSQPFGGENPAGAFNDPNASPTRDAMIVRNSPTDVPDPSRGDGPNYMNPLSAGGFDRYLLERYDPKFVDRVRMNPEQYQSAYDLYVRNGGRL